MGENKKFRRDYYVLKGAEVYKENEFTVRVES